MKKSNHPFADDRVLYFKDPKDSSRKCLDLIITLSKVAGYKYTKSIPFLYTHTEYVKKRIKKTIPFTIASKKYLGMN
jgi:hypothetical protein